MAEALRGWSKAPQPSAWPAAVGKLTAGGAAELKTQVQELGVVFGDGRATDELSKIVFNGDAEPGARRQALRALLAGKPAHMAASLQQLAGDRVVAIEAIRGLASYDHPETPSRILANWDRYGPAERSETINTLCSRPAYAKALLDMLREAKIPKNDVSAFHARQIRAFDIPDLNRDLAELWGDVRVSTADKRSLIDRLKSHITPTSLAEAQPTQGRVLFQKSCANCHVLYGVGRKVGPDLTGSNRRNLDYLLENVVDPSASVGSDFRAWVVLLDDGRLLNGVVTDQTERTVTLQTAQESVTLDRKTIDQMQHTANSLMPDGLLQQLTDEQVRDLMAYLMSADQVALPE
jgi:putative heme-binding domain-containing protein